MKPNRGVDLGSVRWSRSRSRSSYSNGTGTGGECLEVADHLPGVVPVRDSKNPEGPALVLSARAWALFVKSL